MRKRQPDGGFNGLGTSPSNTIRLFALATIGSAINGATESIAKGIKSMADDIISSSSTRKSIERDIKEQFKDSGKKTTKRMIQKSVDKKVDESIKAASKVIELSTNTIEYSAGFYNNILSDEVK